MKRFSFRYSVLTFHSDQLWFPLAFWALFAIICAIVNGDPAFDNAARGYIGVVIPLIAGIMSAYAGLDDPALELRFATPMSSVRMLAERLGLILAVQTLCALAFEAYYLAIGGNFIILGGFWNIQLAWFIPTIALMGFGLIMAMLTTKAVGGSLLTAVVWLLVFITRSAMAADPALRYVMIYMGALIPDSPILRANQLTLFLLTLLFFAASCALYQRQERYI